MATMQADVTDLTPPTPGAVEQKAEVIGDYEILGKLGQGGMGAVYRARQISLDRVVALKVLPADLEEDENYVARFQREAAVAAGLNHPNLVQVYASGQADGSHFIAMKLVEGENLRQRLKRGELPITESLRICLEVARGLQFAWQRAQLIHRDIKPSNIYLSTTGEVKVGDLGLAKSLLNNTSGLTHTGTALGTPHYMSPEQARGERAIDLRADIYSLGCTLYQLLTGATPYHGTDPAAVINMHINAPPPAIMKVLPQCPISLGRLVNKMLRKARHERHQTYEELLAAMEQALAQLEQGTSAGPSALVTAWKEIGAAEQHRLVARGPTPVAKSLTASRLPAARKSRTGLWLGLASAVLALGAGAYFLWKPAAPQSVAVSPSIKAGTPPKVDLTAPPRASAAAAEQWQDVLVDPAKLALTGAVQRTPEGLRFMEFGSAIVSAGRSPQRDGAVRIKLAFPGWRVGLHVRSSFKGSYQLWAAETGFALTLANHASGRNETKRLREFPLPASLQPGQEYELELRAVGQTLTAKLNGEILGTVTDGTFTEGDFHVGDHDRNGPPVVVKAMEVLDLDSPGVAPGTPSAISVSATPTPATATQTAPFINSLGMKFVPVPITGGPTDKPRVLFSIWETRVQDYAAYAAANPKADGSWKTQAKDGVPVGREPDHPVVGVSWEDAQAFCQWLTAKETAEGKLPQGMKYRLPSDEEWSWAVGLPPEQGATPAEKSGKNSVDFPWGKDWPPTKKVGNYADEAFHAKFPLKEDTKNIWDKNRWIEGYRDGYATTSPIAAFPGNEYGLYDMGGNVFEWCEDWFDPSHKDRVLRGAGWNVSDRRYLLSSSRVLNLPGHRGIYDGFRCVLAASSPASSAVSPAPVPPGSAAATKDAPEIRPRPDHRRADGPTARALQRVGDAGAGLRGVREGDEA